MVTCLGTELWDQFPILVMGSYWLESEQVLSYHSLCEVICVSAEVICVSALLHLQETFLEAIHHVYLLQSFFSIDS